MKKFVLDTGILLHYIRESKLAKDIERELKLMARDSIPIISAVSVGEIEGFCQRQRWSESKIAAMKRILSKVLIINISGHDNLLMETYATLWNYSKNALPENKTGQSIGIGQNDVWIAATAKVADAALVTTNGDFDHLNGNWIRVFKYSL